MPRRKSETRPDPIEALRDDPLGEMNRRLVAIHYSMEENLDDADVRVAISRKLMDLIHDVNAARRAGLATKSAAAS
jgi:hypothetical protein